MNLAEKIVMETFKKHQGQQEVERWNEVGKIIDFFEGDQNRYTQKYLKRKEAKDDHFPYTYSNITFWIAKKISKVYQKAPERDMNNRYLELVQNKNTWMKDIERNLRVLPVVLVRPTLNNDDIFDYQIVRQFKGVPNKFDKSKFDKIWYKLGNESGDILWAYWDNEKYMIVNDFGKPIKNQEEYGANQDFENPYSKIPFVPMRFRRVIEDCWAGGDEGIVNTNEMVNLHLTDMNWMARYASFKQPVLISQTANTDKIEWGYDKLVRIKTGGDPNNSPSFSLMDVQANFSENFKFIRDQIELLAQRKGISINWELKGTPSGFSLIVKNIDLLENWQDDIEYCLKWEKDLFEMEKHVYNIESSRSFPESKLKINFADIKFPTDPKEQREQDDWMIKNNYKSYLDVMRQFDKDATDEELRKKYEENKQINQELGNQTGLLGQTFE